MNIDARCNLLKLFYIWDDFCWFLHLIDISLFIKFCIKNNLLWNLVINSMSSNICYYCYKFLCSWFFFSVYLSIIFTFFVIKLYNIIFIYLCMCFSSSHSRDHLSFKFVLYLLSTSVILYLQFMYFRFPSFSLLGNPVKSLTFSLVSWFWFLPQFRKIPGIFPQNLFSFMCVWWGRAGMQHYMYT